MRILMLSWEYPPRSVGGLARHVEDLANALSKTGSEVHVVTCGTETAPNYEVVNGVCIHRFEPYPVQTPDFLTWVLQLNIKMLELIIQIIQQEGPFDIIHAHDWLAAFAGGAAKHSYKIPLIATIHATEAGRNCGLHNEEQRYINSVEWWLTYEAWKVIVCSSHMKSEVRSIFNVPDDKIVILPNGVNADKFKSLKVEPEFKQRFAAEEEKIVFFVGRLVREKGVQVLIESAPAILNAVPEAKFIIAGKGPMSSELQYRVKSMGMEEKFLFTGYIDDETRNKLYSIASAAVFPSLYEPFGIVALEGMAAGTPVVVSDTGGLSEIITHGEEGLKAFPDHARSLSDNIIRLLKDDLYACHISSKALKLVQEVYDWNTIAENTYEIYGKILREYRSTPWKNQHNKFNRVWDYALSFVSQQRSCREAQQGREKSDTVEVERAEDFKNRGRYDLISHRITSNNHREGGEKH